CLAPPSLVVVEGSAWGDAHCTGFSIYCARCRPAGACDRPRRSLSSGTGSLPRQHDDHADARIGDRSRGRCLVVRRRGARDGRRRPGADPRGTRAPPGWWRIIGASGAAASTLEIDSTGSIALEASGSTKSRVDFSGDCLLETSDDMQTPTLKGDGT